MAACADVAVFAAGVRGDVGADAEASGAAEGGRAEAAEMAKKQTRRTVSLSRETHDTAAKAATAAGMPMSEWVTRLIATACPDLPPQSHVRALIRHEPPASKPLLAMTRADVEAVLAPRIVVTAATPAPPGPKKPNKTCAHCGKRPGDTFDEDGYAICTTCSTTFGQSTWGTRR